MLSTFVWLSVLLCVCVPSEAVSLRAFSGKDPGRLSKPKKRAERASSSGFGARVDPVVTEVQPALVGTLANRRSHWVGDHLRADNTGDDESNKRREHRRPRESEERFHGSNDVSSPPLGNDGLDDDGTDGGGDGGSNGNDRQDGPEDLGKEDNDADFDWPNPPGLILPATEKRLFRHHTVPGNGLRVLLVSDPRASTSAAAVNCGSGSFGDPTDTPGLAHFLEHMLFLGSDEYPSDHDWKFYLGAHGGSYNAFTRHEDTLFYFSVHSEFFPGALHRLSRFFIAPQLAEDPMEREMHAVDHEYGKSRQDDHRRLIQLQAHLAEPSADFHKFGTGNLRTLSAVSRGELQARLRRLWTTQFHAENLWLVLLDRIPLDEMEQQVNDLFSGVRRDGAFVEPNLAASSLSPSRTVTQSHSSASPPRDEAQNVKREDVYPYAKSTLASKVLYQPVRGGISLLITWPLPAQWTSYRDDSLGYISSLVRAKSEGSLLHVLQEGGLLRSLHCPAEEVSTSTFALFTLRLSLTSEGRKRMDEVLQVVFAFLQLVQDHGVELWRFEELRNVSRLGFDYSEKETSGNLVQRAAANMRRFAPEHVVVAESLLDQYRPRHIRTLLGFLVPSRMLLYLSSKHLGEREGQGGEGGTGILEAELKTSVEPWYNTKYHIEPIPTETLRNYSGPLARSHPLSLKLRLPIKNNFLPQRLGLLPEAPLTPRTPTQSDWELPSWPPLDVGPRIPILAYEAVAPEPPVRLWLLQHSFGLPKAQLRCQLWLGSGARSRRSPRTFLLMRLFLSLLRIRLQRTLHAQSIAGFEWGLTHGLAHIELRLSGFNDGFEDVAALLFQAVTGNAGLKAGTDAGGRGGMGGASGDGAAGTDGRGDGAKSDHDDHASDTWYNDDDDDENDEDDNTPIAPNGFNSSQLEFSEQDFAFARSDAFLGYRNKRFDRPSSLAETLRSRLLGDESFSEPQLLRALNHLSLADVVAFRRLLLVDMQLECLLAGNVDERSSLALSQIIDTELKFTSITPRVRLPPRLAMLPGNARLTMTLEHPNPAELNSAVHTYYQLPADWSTPEGPDMSVLYCRLLARVASKPLEQRLRTELQLAYSLHSKCVEMSWALPIPAFAITLTSSTQPASAASHAISDFLPRLRAHIRALAGSSPSSSPSSSSPPSLQSFITSLRTDFEHNLSTLSAEMARLWDEIVSQEYRFNRRAELAQLLGAGPIDDSAESEPEQPGSDNSAEESSEEETLRNEIGKESTRGTGGSTRDDVEGGHTHDQDGSSTPPLSPPSSTAPTSPPVLSASGFLEFFDALFGFQPSNVVGAGGFLEVQVSPSRPVRTGTELKKDPADAGKDTGAVTHGSTSTSSTSLLTLPPLSVSTFPSAALSECVDPTLARASFLSFAENIEKVQLSVDNDGHNDNDNHYNVQTQQQTQIARPSSLSPLSITEWRFQAGSAVLSAAAGDQVWEGELVQTSSEQDEDEDMNAVLGNEPANTLAASTAFPSVELHVVGADLDIGCGVQADGARVMYTPFERVSDLSRRLFAFPLRVPRYRPP